MRVSGAEQVHVSTWEGAFAFPVQLEKVAAGSLKDILPFLHKISFFYSKLRHLFYSLLKRPIL